MAATRRVLMLGLDGFDAAFGDRLMAEGELPFLRALLARGARIDLDHGLSKRTGLAWEHVSTGRSPEAAGRYAAVHFNPRTYEVWQDPTRMAPFPAALGARTVVFDAPYFDLAKAPAVQGIVRWGSHDPGAEASARPASLTADLAARFGAYPATAWLYGFVWPSPERTQAMAEGLVRGVDARAEAACWLFREALPRWDLAYMVVSELHAAAEALWHGVDPAHPLHTHPSASPAGEGLRQIYHAVDRLVGRLAEAFPDVTIVAFNLHGMGSNDSDLPSMILLPELLMRNANGGQGLLPSVPDPDPETGVVTLPPDEVWGEMIDRHMTAARPPRQRRRVQRSLAGRILHRLTRSGQRADPIPQARRSLGWMPAGRYTTHWPAMRAFALPSYYDGRVRINLAGRERNGLVARSDYDRACDEVEALVCACRDTRTGQPVVHSVERIGGRNPLELGETESDLLFEWGGIL